MQLGGRPVGRAPPADDEDALAEVVGPVVELGDEGQVLPRHPEGAQLAPLPHGVDQVAAGVSAQRAAFLDGVHRLREGGPAQLHGILARPVGDVDCGHQEPFLVGLDAGHPLPSADALLDLEAAGDAAVVVDEAALDDQLVDVEVVPRLAGPLREGVEGELHPLARRQGEQVFGDVVPQAADLLLGDQEGVEGVVAPELQGDLLRPGEQLPRVVEDAEQVHRRKAGAQEGAEVEAQEAAGVMAEVVAELRVALLQNRTVAEVRVPAAEDHRQGQSRGTAADDDDGVVLGGLAHRPATRPAPPARRPPSRRNSAPAG